MEKKQNKKIFISFWQIFFQQDSEFAKPELIKKNLWEGHHLIMIRLNTFLISIIIQKVVF